MKQLTLTRIFRQAVSSALLITGAATAGCGVNVASYDAPLCTATSQLSVEGLKPAMPVDYLEYRQIADFGGPDPVASSTGTKCGGATNRTMCEMAVANQTFGTGFYRRCVDACTAGALLATRGDQVIVVDSKAALDAFLAPYDTPQDAVFAALSSGRSVSCSDKSKGAVKAVEGGYQVVTSSGTGCGTSDPIMQYVLFVDTTGKVTEIDSSVLQPGMPGCVIGRRPAGLREGARPARRCVGSSCVGDYFAANTRLEAASVTAFRVLHEELAAHGAPPELLRLARRSARDEVRHTRMTGRLARRYGARPLRPSVQSQALRPLEELLIENAGEGCVRETFGALVGKWQAQRAQDPAIRRAMAKIAHDETRHATLAWKVAAWAEPRLSEAARARVHAARRQAVATLRKELEREPALELRTAAGLPSAAESLVLLEQLERLLWQAA